MAKNKGKFGKGKVKEHEVDEFVSGFQRLGQRLRPHLVPLGVALAALTLTLIAYYSYSAWKAHKERKATTALVKAFDIAERRVSATDLPENTDPNDKTIVYKTEKERSEAVLEALKSVSSSTRVGKNAQLLQAGTLYDLGRYAEAAKLYGAVAESSLARTLKRLAREGIGYALEAEADKAKSVDGWRQALAAFRKVQTDDKASGYDITLFHEGRLLAKLDKKKQAIEAFEKLRKLKPPSIFNSDAERRLAVLKGNDTRPQPKPKKQVDKKQVDKKSPKKPSPPQNNKTDAKN